MDCVRWLGDLCLSKSMDETILLWRPEDAPDNSSATTSNRFTVLQVRKLPSTHMPPHRTGKISAQGAVFVDRGGSVMND